MGDFACDRDTKSATNQDTVPHRIRESSLATTSWPIPYHPIPSHPIPPHPVCPVPSRRDPSRISQNMGSSNRSNRGLDVVQEGRHGGYRVSHRRVHVHQPPREGGAQRLGGPEVSLFFRVFLVFLWVDWAAWKSLHTAVMFSSNSSR